MSTIDPMVRRFCDQLRDEGLIAEAGGLEGALHALDIEADYNAHATACWEGVRWVLGRQGPSVGEKIMALQKVLTNRGTIRLPADLGW